MGQCQSVNQKPSTTAKVTKQLSQGAAKTTPAPDTTSISTTRIQYNTLQFGQRLGGGGFCNVHKGVLNSTKYAIKTLRYVTEDSTQQFIQETKFLTELNHPYIIKCLGWTDQPKYTMVLELGQKSLMEYVTGCAHTPPIWEERLQYVYDIASALHYLHQRDIIHADVKPDNAVLVSSPSTGEVVAKLCDFGFARQLPPSATNTLLDEGTTEFMAPEVLNNKKGSKSSDIYALAMLAWYLANDKDVWGAFPGCNSDKIIKKVKAGKRATIPPSCPAILSQFITWGWKQIPEDRPTADQVVELLKPHVARK